MSSKAYRFPIGLERLVPYAEKFGIADDVERWNKVQEADLTELAALVGAIEEVDQEIFFDWLEGSESESRDPSDEYVAASALMMAAEQARLRLKAAGP